MTADITTHIELQAELETLRRRVIELELQLAEAKPHPFMEQKLIAIEAAMDGIAILDHQGRYSYMNEAHAKIHGYDRPEDLLGQSWMVVVPDELLEWYEKEALPAFVRDRRWKGETVSKRRDGSRHPTEVSLTLLDDGGIVCIVRDISQQKEAEFERLRLQNEVIAVQEAALAELSTPLIPISQQVVIMPLIGAMDSQRAQRVIETLLSGVAQTGAQVAILDITGVSIVDTQVANAFLRAAQSVKLLGAQVVLTGIRPEVAQTLIGLGVDLGSIVTRSTLESGIGYAMERRQVPVR